MKKLHIYIILFIIYIYINIIILTNCYHFLQIFKNFILLIN